MTASLTDIDLEIEKMFENARPMSELDLDAMARANREIMNSSSFKAGVIKDQFLHAMIEAMEKCDLTQAQLADSMGKSRQYINRFFDEDRKRNYTIDTMVEIMHHLGVNVRLEFGYHDDVVMKSSLNVHPNIGQFVHWGDGRRAVGAPADVYKESEVEKTIDANLIHEPIAA